jgi:CubicO group peptidase (beta-lactamase class C family)
MAKFRFILAFAHIAFKLCYSSQVLLSGDSSDIQVSRSGVRPSQFPTSNAAWTYRWYEGALNGFPDNAAAHKYFTDLMGFFIEENNITQAQLSIAKDGSQLMNYGYTWQDPDYPDTTPNATFLLASVSKIYCVAAIQSIFNTTDVTPETKVYERLGYTSAADPAVFDITVQNLLEHQGGDDRSQSGDPAYMMRTIALDMSNGTRPATERDIIEWKLRQKLDYPPGTAPLPDGIYSNYGYILLSYLVQNVTNSTSYYTYLNDKVLTPNNLDVRQWLTDPKYHTNDAVQQIDPYTGLSALDPLSPDEVPSVFGGDGMYKDSDMGGAGLAASAATLTRTVNLYPAWGWGPGRAPWSGRTGSTPGAFTWVSSRWDGVDWAIAFNSRNWDQNNVQVLAEKIDQFLNDNRVGL